MVPQTYSLLVSDLKIMCTASHTPIDRWRHEVGDHGQAAAAHGGLCLPFQNTSYPPLHLASPPPPPKSSAIFFIKSTKRPTPGGKGGRARAIGFLAPWTRRRRRRPHLPQPRRPRTGPIHPAAPSRFVRLPFLPRCCFARFAPVFGGPCGSTGQCWLKSVVVAVLIGGFRQVCGEIWFCSYGTSA
jgi:hypothetical protein